MIPILAQAQLTQADLKAELAKRRAQERARFLSPMGKRRSVRITGLIVLGLALVLTIVLSLSVGARAIAPSDVISALFAPDMTRSEHLVVLDLRLPRTLAGIAIGAMLASAGALMQGITRNPLADPGLLGVNAGASFAVVFAIWYLGITGYDGLVGFAFFGAGAVAVLVYLLGSVGRGGSSPVRLTLAGAAVNALLLALVFAILLLSQETLDVYRFWMVGALSGIHTETLVKLIPYAVIGLALAAAVSTSLNAIALGDEAAKALGTRLGLARVGAVVAVTLLCGASVAIAGPIAFLGLVVPHLARILCGADQRWLLAYSVLLGPVLLLLADIAGRVVMPPGEVQVGIMTALVGGPLFVLIVRRIRLVQI